MLQLVMACMRSSSSPGLFALVTVLYRLHQLIELVDLFVWFCA